MVTIQRISEDDFRAMAEEWNAFLAASTNDTVFLTWEWLISWWDAFASPEREFYFLAARDAAGRMVGTFPLQLVTLRLAPGLTFRTLLFIGRGWHDRRWVEYTTFMMPPALPGHEKQVYGAAAAYLAAHAKEWDLAALGNLLAEHPTTPVLAGELRQRFKVRRARQEGNYVIKLAETYEGFLKGVSHNQRRLFQRKTKRVQRDYAARLTAVTAEDQIGDYLADYYRLVSQRHNWKPTPRQEDFMGLLCRRLSRRGWLRNYLLRLNDVPAVTQFGFAYKRRYYAYKAAFNPAFASSSPGTALMALVLQHEIAEGTREFDYLVGEYDYKQYWCNEVRDVDYLLVFSRRFASRIKAGTLLLLVQGLDRARRRAGNLRDRWRRRKP